MDEIRSTNRQQHSAATDLESADVVDLAYVELSRDHRAHELGEPADDAVAPDERLECPFCGDLGCSRHTTPR